MKPEDIYRLQLPVSPRFSPEGRWVAFVLQGWDEEKDRSITNIELLDLKEGKRRALTRGCCDKHPRFSPDGSKLAFISRRSGQHNIWVVDLNGGQPRQIEFEGRVISPPVWSPDGGWIAFTAFGSPACCQEEGGITVVRKFYHKYDSLGFFRGQYSQIYIARASTGSNNQDITSITDSDYNHFNPAWSPDGKKLAYTIMREDYLEKGVFKHDICYYDFTGDNSRTVIKGKGPVKSLTWSPDGYSLAFIGHQNRYGRATTEGVWLIPLLEDSPLTAGGMFNLTADLERPVGTAVDADLSYCCQQTASLKWSKNGSRIFFLAADEGSSYIYSVRVPGRLSDIVAGDSRINELFPALEKIRVIKKRAGERGKNIRYFDQFQGDFIYSASQPDIPDELYLQSGDNVEKISSFNKQLTVDADFFPADRFNYRGAEDWEIDGWVLNKGEHHPLVVIVHGGPHLAYGDSFMLQSQVLAAAGYTVFYANPRGSQSYGQSFTSAVVQDWGRNDYQDIMTGVDYVLNQGWADPERVGILGWSYGGYLTCWSIAHSDRFRAAVAGGSVTNLYSFYGTSDIGYSFGEFEIGGTSCHSKEELIYRSPINYVSQIETPLLILHGEDDLRCPISQSEELFTALIRCGKQTVFVRYPGESHILKKPSHIVDRWQRTLEWFEEYL